MGKRKTVIEIPIALMGKMITGSYQGRMAMAVKKQNLQDSGAGYKWGVAGIRGQGSENQHAVY